MTEVFFILTTIFVAYVVYVIVNEKKSTAKPAVHEAQPVAVQVVAAKTSTEPEVAEQIAPPEEIKKAVSPTAGSPAAKSGLRDPKTGEVATVYSNYRFTKRWIKEALVAEGLLEKVYKNNELNAEIDVAIKAAIVKLEAIDKYRA